MSVVELNLRQKKLLQQLAELRKTKQLAEPFTPFPVDLMNYVVYLRSRYNLRIQWISDLEVLCLAGYLTYEWNRMWTSKKYAVSKAGMGILDDPVFITKDDYKREHPSLSGFDLFIDSTTQPPSNESFNHLLIADLEKMTIALKEAFTNALSGVELGNVVAELNLVTSHLMTAQPDKNDIANSIQIMGNEIMQQVAADLGNPMAADSSHLLMVFSLWNKQVVKRLMLETI
ncbi:MAG: hypothetical protein AB8G95_10145 [Anaerolineae bacterium]